MSLALDAFAVGYSTSERGTLSPHTQSPGRWLIRSCGLLLLLLRGNGFLQRRLRLVEPPRLDLGLEQLVQLRGGKPGVSNRALIPCGFTHPAGSGMMNHAAMANGAPIPV